MAAYAIFFVMLVIVAIGITTITGNVAVDEFITAMNPFISSGEVSSQWVYYWNFALGLWIIFPILGMIILFIWAVVRAIERKQEQEGF